MPAWQLAAKFSSECRPCALTDIQILNKVEKKQQKIAKNYKKKPNFGKRDQFARSLFRP